jgi:predicted DCC family thiol-disulfide oxidoreductase YuxK
VRLSDGRLLSGAAAFVELWLTMPGWRWLGRIGRLPGVTPLLELSYRGFLQLRPQLQKVMRAAEARR